MLSAVRAPIAPPTPAEAPTVTMRVIADLLARRTGQQLVNSRAWRIDTVLQPLLRVRGFATLEQLAAALPPDGAGPLADLVIEALLNQETSFYRDAGVIEAVSEVLLARRVANPSRRLRVWSAGCSTGQEPYSLAMLLAERQGACDIVATDIADSGMVRARAGRFSQFEIQRGLPIRRMLDWFDQDGDEWVANAELVKLVSFRRQNLVFEPPPFGQFDVILCRNVLLYFPAAVRTRVFANLAGALRPDGLLVLGAGETTIGQTELFKPSAAQRGMYELAAT